MRSQTLPSVPSVSSALSWLLEGQDPLDYYYQAWYGRNKRLCTIERFVIRLNGSLESNRSRHGFIHTWSNVWSFSGWFFSLLWHIVNLGHPLHNILISSSRIRFIIFPDRLDRNVRITMSPISVRYAQDIVIVTLRSNLSGPNSIISCVIRRSMYCVADATIGQYVIAKREPIR